jgi:hypothetical protein
MGDNGIPSFMIIAAVTIIVVALIMAIGVFTWVFLLMSP